MVGLGGNGGYRILDLRTRTESVGANEEKVAKGDTEIQTLSKTKSYEVRLDGAPVRDGDAMLTSLG